MMIQTITPTLGQAGEGGKLTVRRRRKHNHKVPRNVADWKWEKEKKYCHPTKNCATLRPNKIESCSRLPARGSSDVSAANTPQKNTVLESRRRSQVDAAKPQRSPDQHEGSRGCKFALTHRYIGRIEKLVSAETQNPTPSTGIMRLQKGVEMWAT